MEESKDIIMIYLKNQKNRAFDNFAKELQEDATNFFKTAEHNNHINSISILIYEREQALKVMKGINKKLKK
jgi:hypothetical protein